MSYPKAADVDAWLATREAGVPGLRPGAEKHVVWAGDPGRVTDLSVVYVHGFSAAAPEIRPVPDHVAQALGANVHFARLTEHGRDGAAMAEGDAAAWLRDTQEALAIGRAIGRRVLVISCSTGGPLVAQALETDLSGMVGAVFVSPNFKLRSAIVSVLLNLPGVRWWGPVLLGRERRFEPLNPDHAAHWTVRYPTVAVLPMRDTLRAFRHVDVARIGVPALMVISDNDQVISAPEARRVAGQWGGGAEVALLYPGPRDDPHEHVIAGDILSPSQTAPAVAGILDWVKRRGI